MPCTGGPVFVLLGNFQLLSVQVSVRFSINQKSETGTRNPEPGTQNPEPGTVIVWLVFYRNVSKPLIRKIQEETILFKTLRILRGFIAISNYSNCF